MVGPQRSAMFNVLDEPFLRSIGKNIDLDEMLKVEQRPFEYNFPPDGKDGSVFCQITPDWSSGPNNPTLVFCRIIKNHRAGTDVAELLHEAVETPEYAESLKMKVLKDEVFAYNSSGDTHGRRAIDHACLECKHAMQSSLQFLERYQIHGPELHVSATAVVLEATDLAPTVRSDDGTVSTRVALKGMREVDQVVTELKGRNGLNRGYAHAAENIESQPRPQTIWGHGEERALPNMHVTAIKMNTLIQAAHTLAP